MKEGKILGKKETKKFSKKLRKQLDAMTAGTRYTTDTATGIISKDEPEPKKKGGKDGKDEQKD